MVPRDGSRTSVVWECERGAEKPPSSRPHSLVSSSLMRLLAQERMRARAHTPWVGVQGATFKK